MISPRELMEAMRTLKEECRSHEDCKDCPLRYGSEAICVFDTCTPGEIALLPEPRILSYQIVRGES